MKLVCVGGAMGGREQAQKGKWMAYFSKGKAAKVSGGQIWEQLECLFKEFGFCFSPVDNGREQRTICILGRDSDRMEERVRD